MSAALSILLSLAGFWAGSAAFHGLEAMRRRKGAKAPRPRRERDLAPSEPIPLDLRIRYRLELRQLAEERFPLWRPDPAKLARAGMRSADRAP